MKCFNHDIYQQLRRLCGPSLLRLYVSGHYNILQKSLWMEWTEYYMLQVIQSQGLIMIQGFPGGDLFIHFKSTDSLYFLIISTR